jgi:hypothetical protein
MGTGSHALRDSDELLGLGIERPRFEHVFAERDKCVVRLGR